MDNCGAQSPRQLQCLTQPILKKWDCVVEKPKTYRNSEIIPGRFNNNSIRSSDHNGPHKHVKYSLENDRLQRDSNQTLLYSDSSNESFSKNCNKNRLKRSTASPQFRNYCVWLISVLLVLVIVAILHILVLNPIFEQILLKKRGRTGNIWEITTTMKTKISHINQQQQQKYLITKNGLISSTAPSNIFSTTNKHENLDRIKNELQSQRQSSIIATFTSRKPTTTTRLYKVTKTAIQNFKKLRNFNGSTNSKYRSRTTASIHPNIQQTNENKHYNDNNVYQKIFYSKHDSIKWKQQSNPVKAVSKTIATSTKIHQLSNFSDFESINKLHSTTAAKNMILTNVATTSTLPMPLTTKPSIQEYKFHKENSSSGTFHNANISFDVSMQKANESLTTVVPINKMSIKSRDNLINSKAGMDIDSADNVISFKNNAEKDVKGFHDKNGQESNYILDNNAFFDDENIVPVEIFIEPNEILDQIENDYNKEALYNNQQKNQNLKSPEPVWRRLPPEQSSSLQKTLSSSVVPIQKPTNAKNERVSDSRQLKSLSQNVILQKTATNAQRRTAPIIVTALFDIGRGNWTRFTRHFDTYLSFFKKLFLLDNFMIIYCERKVIDYIYGELENDLHPIPVNFNRLQIVEMSLRDLPLWRYRDEIQELLDEEQRNWSPQWDPQMRTHPEALYADYDILVNSKPYFLQNATNISNFETDSNFYVWIDAGYGHESLKTIPIGLWTPKLPPNKITLLKLTTVIENVEGYTIDHVYRKRRSVISGGFLAGDISTIRRFHVFFFKTFMELLDDDKVDDDQTTLLMTIGRFRSTFNIIHGGWFDAFKLLPSHLSFSFFIK